MTICHIIGCALKDECNNFNNLIKKLIVERNNNDLCLNIEYNFVFGLCCAFPSVY